jgi:hypothetical protein
MTVTVSNGCLRSLTRYTKQLLHWIVAYIIFIGFVTSVAQIIRRQVVRGQMNSEGSGSESAVRITVCRDWGKPRRNSSRVPGVPTETGPVIRVQSGTSIAHSPRHAVLRALRPLYEAA